MKEDKIKRINEKIGDIEQNLEGLYQIFPGNFEDYMKEHHSRAACERYFERIVESIVDVSFLILRLKEIEMPDDEEGVFISLSKKKIISEELAKKLKDAKGMRNIIAHEYGKVDDSLVFHAIKDELKQDTTKFLDFIGGVIAEYE